MSKPQVKVALAIVRRTGRILVARRLDDAHLGGLWEFPGGKCEPGETPVAAALRELREECAVEARPGAVMPPFVAEYPERIVQLTAVHCTWLRGEGEPLGCAAVRWVTLPELRALEMPLGNDAIIAELAQYADVADSR